MPQPHSGKFIERRHFPCIIVFEIGKLERNSIPIERLSVTISTENDLDRCPCDYPRLEFGAITLWMNYAGIMISTQLAFAASTIEIGIDQVACLICPISEKIFIRFGVTDAHVPVGRRAVIGSCLTVYYSAGKSLGLRLRYRNVSESSCNENIKQEYDVD